MVLRHFVAPDNSSGDTFARPNMSASRATPLGVYGDSHGIMSLFRAYAGIWGQEPVTAANRPPLPTGEERQKLTNLVTLQTTCSHPGKRTNLAPIGNPRALHRAGDAVHCSSIDFSLQTRVSWCAGCSRRQGCSLNVLARQQSGSSAQLLLDIAEQGRPIVGSALPE